MKDYRKSKILITGGHLTPAIAVINELKKRGFHDFVWVGHKHNQQGNKELSPEFVTVNNLKIPFVNLRAGKLTRSWGKNEILPGIINLLLIFWGIFKSIYIVIRYRPNLIVSFGGYIALPIVIVGKLFFVKIITHEQTMVVGLANKIISRFADKVLISWDSSKKYFNQNKTVLTGNPIRRDIFTIKSSELTKDFDQNYPTLLIYGGNQGSHEINKRIFPILEDLLNHCNIIHQTGNSSVTNDYIKAKDLREKLPVHLKLRYKVKDYILQDQVGEALNKSDIIFGRSGANNITEILALGKLSILMPIPWSSHNEQHLNAEYVVNTGLGYIVIQKESLTPNTLLDILFMGFDQLKTGRGFNGKPISQCKEIAKSRIILDAPQNVANEIQKILKL